MTQKKIKQDQLSLNGVTINDDGTVFIPSGEGLSIAGAGFIDIGAGNIVLDNDYARIQKMLVIVNAVGWYNTLMPNATGSNTTATLPSATTTLVGNDTADTLTNKRINPRVVAITSNFAPQPNADTTDLYEITALATNITTFQNPSGTAVDGQKLLVRIKDNGSARTISWGANYRGIGAPLPSTTVASKPMYIEMVYNSADTKWDVVDVRVEGWISYTPTLTNITIGNGTVTAKYKDINGTIFFEVVLVFGTTTAFGAVANYTQSPRVSLPVTGVVNSWSGTSIAGYSGAVMPGGARMSYDASAATGTGSATAPQWYDTSNFFDSNLSSSSTNLHDVGDCITWSGFYEKA